MSETVQNHSVTLRPATLVDLDAINIVIERAVHTWKLPQRVKRLSLVSCRYNTIDLEMLHIVVTEDSKKRIIGVAAWEPADARDAPPGCNALLLHGIYVDPDNHRQGIGSRLLNAAELAAREQGFDGLLVKAQPGATGFFTSRGMQPLAVADSQRDYGNRYWKSRCN
jgi:N-acetylglutamate synthase-like GNAT family acetyltransferase